MVPTKIFHIPVPLSTKTNFCRTSILSLKSSPFCFGELSSWLTTYHWYQPIHHIQIQPFFCKFFGKPTLLFCTCSIAMLVDCLWSLICTVNSKVLYICICFWLLAHKFTWFISSWEKITVGKSWTNTQDYNYFVTPVIFFQKTLSTNI